MIRGSRRGCRLPAVGFGLVANAYLKGTYSEVYSHIGQEKDGLLVLCVVGDGEAETGPLAASWHSNNFLNPISDGAVLPVLHLNGYKIASPTVLARISENELTELMGGYGYDPHYVSGDDPATVHQQLVAALDEVADRIAAIQRHAWSARTFSDRDGAMVNTVVSGPTNTQHHHRWSSLPSGQAGGSGGIRTPGTSRYARFQVAGEPCVGVCPRLSSCGSSRDPSGSAWGRQQSVATRLLHADTPSIRPAASSRSAGTAARFVVAGDQRRRPWTD